MSTEVLTRCFTQPLQSMRRRISVSLYFLTIKSGGDHLYYVRNERSLDSSSTFVTCMKGHSEGDNGIVPKTCAAPEAQLHTQGCRSDLFKRVKAIGCVLMRSVRLLRFLSQRKTNFHNPAVMAAYSFTAAMISSYSCIISSSSKTSHFSRRSTASDLSNRL